MTRFGIVGLGWRAEFFMRVARELPERFTVVGAVGRNRERAGAFSQKWDVPTFGAINDLVSSVDPLFVVVSVPWDASVGVLTACARHGLPVLGETPPAPDLAGLHALWNVVREGGRIQVAEQYSFQPLHSARLAVIRSGRVGEPTQAQVSAAHGYHGISLIRHYLGVSFEDVTITASSFVSPIVKSPGREGSPAEEQIVDSSQEIAQFRFEGGKFGVYDFTGDQYFSYIRGPRVLIRGERGEIEGERVRFLLDSKSGIEADLRRVDTGHDGNLEGYYHRGYTMDGRWVYANPFTPARLSDDEIAVASTLEGMASYSRGGPDFYSLAEAAQDRYLDLLMQEALRSGQPVKSLPQPWAI